jgi:hypothetical protein
MTTAARSDPKLDPAGAQKMTSGMNDDGYREYRDQGAARARDERTANRLLFKRARSTRRLYEKAVTRLWVGNAGGAVVTISYLAATSNVKSLSLWPIYFFMVGLLLLVVEQIWHLGHEWKTIKDNQSAGSLLEFRTNYFKYPLEAANLTWNVIMSLLATICFVLGCIAGVWEIARG